MFSCLSNPFQIPSLRWFSCLSNPFQIPSLRWFTRFLEPFAWGKNVSLRTIFQYFSTVWVARPAPQEIVSTFTPPRTNISSEASWLEDDPFLLIYEPLLGNMLLLLIFQYSVCQSWAKKKLILGCPRKLVSG